MILSKSIYCTEDDFKNEVFRPAFEKSKRIEIASGYFSVEVFELFIDEFYKNDELEKFKLIIGADTSIESLNFIKELVECSNEQFKQKLGEKFFSNISNVSDKTIIKLHELLIKDILEIKVGILKSGDIFHPKNYLFTNNQFYLSVTGSVNFTVAGMMRNFENIEAKNEKERYLSIHENFELLWDDLRDSVTVKDIKDYFINYVEKEANKRNVEIDITEQSSLNIVLRDYQQEAIDGLIDNDFNGFFQMATGTGKTFTSIAALHQFLEDKNKRSILILVPYKHLANQWIDSLNVFFKENRKIICNSEYNWREELQSFRYDDRTNFIVAVNDTYFNNLRIFKRILKSESIIIIDEAHNLTSEMICQIEPQFSHKLGLSATPENYIDETRTLDLFEYFEADTYMYIYELSKAIKNDFLTKYIYKPIIVDLNVQEIELYNNLSEKINKSDNKLEYINKRNLVLEKAENKLELLISEIKNMDLTHTLFYCPVGTNNENNLKYIEHYAKQIKNVRNDITFEQITSEEKASEREEIIKRFESKNTDALLAIKCIDEGYDIPCIKKAFITYSTRNPKEFVQRRGRVLRKHKGKKITEIYDFIVCVDGTIPYDEYNRFKVYSDLAENQDELKLFELERIWEKNE